MAEREREGSVIPSGPPPVTLGRLTLMKRKGGGDVQTIPLDAERITFGRDYDCDVRLYYSDVSKLHCEIVFDIISGSALLHVRGTNGLLHTPSGGSASTYKPPTEIPLCDKDIITIRKKPFRFEYGGSTEFTVPFSPAVQPADYSQVVPSPAKQPVLGSPSSQPIRRRASHRLSLVPEGKTFVPLSPIKSRRQSSLGLGGMQQTPAKSKLNEEVPKEEEEEELQSSEEQIVDVANGDEGDKVYLEMNDDENKENEEPSSVIKPIHDNPFMTPQPTRKAAVRNTSAVPRTRKMKNTNLDEPNTAEAKEKTTTSPVSKDAPAPATPPKTPRSVPLPSASDTPYDSSSTPAPKASATPIPARLVHSTPKGPATLRKALLLRSARKVWQESRSSGVEGAIEVGNVETRRKSTSPKHRAGRKSTSAVPESPAVQDKLDEDHDMSEEEDNEVQEEEEEQDQHDEGNLKWIQENGTAEVSFESDSSGHDSLEADVSLDIPGQGVIEFAMENPEVEEEYINNDYAPNMDEEEEEEEEEEIEYEGHAQEMNTFEEHEEAVNLPADESVEDAQAECPHIEEEEEVDQDEAMSLPGTPQARQPLSKQFFTPQPERNIHKLPRRSLANIGGPPVRFERLPSTPNSFRRERAPPGSMGKPSRRITMAVPEVEQEETAITEEVVERKVFRTPVKSEAARAEALRRRQSLATPRQLPAPPASGFKNPVVETRFADLIATPVHRALLPDSPEPSEQANVVPATPLDDIKARLDKMRQQSIQRADRRATVGFALPSTPRRSESRGIGSWSVNPVRVQGGKDKAPKTPIFPKLQRQAPIVETSNEVKAEEDSPTKIEDNSNAQEHQDPSSPEYETPSSPSTPSYTGLKEMLKGPSLPAKTPDLSGLKTLFPNTPKEIASPSLVGVKEMLKQPTIPATPNFSGMKDMFRQPKVAQTPKFEGIGEMFEEEEEEEEEEEIEEIEAAEDVVSIIDDSEKENVIEEDDGDDSLDCIEIQPVKKSTISSKLPRPATTTSTSKSAPSRSLRTATSTSSVPAKTASKIPARRAAASTSSKATEAASEESRSKSSRSSKGEPSASTEEVIEEPKSRSTRAKRTASVDPEPAPAPTTSRSRSTRAKSAVVIEEEEEEEPVEIEKPPVKSTSTSTRNKSASSRTTRQATAELENEKEKEISKPSRSKKPLSQLPEQVTGTEKEEEKKSQSSTTTSAKSKLPTATATSKKSSTTLAKSTADKDKTSTSAPSRRKAVIGNKENDESVTAQEEKPVITRKRVTSASASTKKDENKSGVPVPVARATRSRK